MWVLAERPADWRTMAPADRRAFRQNQNRKWRDMTRQQKIELQNRMQARWDRLPAVRQDRLQRRFEAQDAARNRRNNAAPPPDMGQPDDMQQPDDGQGMQGDAPDEGPASEPQ